MGNSKVSKPFKNHHSSRIQAPFKKRSEYTPELVNFFNSQKVSKMNRLINHFNIDSYCNFGKNGILQQILQKTLQFPII